MDIRMGQLFSLNRAPATGNERGLKDRGTEIRVKYAQHSKNAEAETQIPRDTEVSRGMNRSK